MRPAHQGKLLPDAAGAVYTVHVAVLLMTVKLKVLVVPERHTHRVAQTCKLLVCEQVVPKTNADAAPDTESIRVCGCQLNPQARPYWQQQQHVRGHTRVPVVLTEAGKAK